MPKKKKEYYEKKIIVEVPEDAETVTTVSSTDEEVSVIYTEDPDPTLVRLTDLEERMEGLESKPDCSDERLEELEREVSDLRSDLESHAEHLPLPGPSITPRRHDTYKVKEDGEKLAKIAKQIWGVSGRYVEIASLNGITDSTNLKKGQVLKLPK